MVGGVAPVIAVVAQAVVVLAGVYLVALGVLATGRPDRAGRFLLGFAGSAGKHYAELAVRFLVGGALLVHAPRMLEPGAFRLFGWLLVATTLVLLCVPWRWHDRFARAAVPGALRYTRVIGVGALMLGIAMLGATLLAGPAAPT